jgi:hypothetical protein
MTGTRPGSTIMAIAMLTLALRRNISMRRRTAADAAQDAHDHGALEH